jgi:diaminohydroxyphosphoribosylaminopyrimidine deaminase/5-amino-6-(5-phosphoribosylamino)uracil reductase
MNRALELARLGLGNVSPNPMVGCVIVHNGSIIGEGFHQQYGSHHAEVNAINDVKNQKLLSESEAYVTLEPCSFFGNTPPCADLLVKHSIKKVYISTIDTNPKVSGRGVEILVHGGIEVEQGILESEGLELNKRFFTFNSKKRPYIILKWAETSDGFIARPNYDSKWISNEYSRKLVHKWRAEEDAVLVGKNTAHYDDPTLNVRDWSGKDPTRIVIDHALKLDRKLKLFNQEIPTICYNVLKDHHEDKLVFKKLDGSNFLQELLGDLHQRKIQSLIIEGGAATMKTFIENGLWDEARIFRAPTCFGQGIPAPRLANAVFDGSEQIMGDLLTYYRNEK